MRRFCLAIRLDLRFDRPVSALESLIAKLKTTCAGLPDRREGSAPATYAMDDIGLSAFSLFFMGSPSFLAHRRALENKQARSNRQTLFGIGAIPTGNHIRKMLNGAPTAAFDPVFYQTIDTEGVLTSFQRLDGRIAVALDGTEHFRSRKIHCPRCSTRKRADGGTEYFHAFLGASIVGPGHRQVLPLPPGFIVPQVGPRSGLTGETGPRAQPRETLAGTPRAGTGPSEAGLSGRRSVRLSADRRRHATGWRQFHSDLQTIIP